jgi:hypothetical protein
MQNVKFSSQFVNLVKLYQSQAPLGIGSLFKLVHALKNLILFKHSLKLWPFFYYIHAKYYTYFLARWSIQYIPPGNLNES